MKSSFAFRAVLIVVLVAFPAPAHAKGFLVERKGSKGSLRSTVDSGTLQASVRNAMGMALGCGGHIGKEQLALIEQSLLQMWRALPKNAKGRAERRSLRYLAHRYFHQQYSLQIRGFEPSRPVNVSRWGSDDILSQRVPAFVELVLESKHADEHGFDLQDAVQMVATIEELIFDAESAVLERVYHYQRKPADKSVTHLGMEQILEDYMIHWLLDGDEEGLRIAMKNKSMLEDTVPHWKQVVAFAHGRIKALDFKRQHLPAVVARPGHNALSRKYSFEDVHQVVGGITKSFASFWESECAAMKTLLVEMDKHHMGRVPLSKFYGTALDTEWRFGESESYLRELGALDETSSWYGKQVIIPNYIQAASNCIISSPHYLVCCSNECEGLMSELEAAIRGEVASPEDLLRLVGNMTSQTTVDHDEPAQLGASLRTQLEQIAATHAGKVPLHGRLFAQWLHYAFPRECPFPHKAGSTAALTPQEFGDGYIASKDEMREHASAALDAEVVADMGKEELQWMSQWSTEEELIADYSTVMRAPWESGYLAVGGLLLFLLCGIAGAIGASRRMMNSEVLLPTHSKTHFV
mmetsp:Transcript_88000/g.204773  ORF Transcript_88000/g.204773 Transcript_88000/m.204773 type:complete len:580 (-) Transcript_88000:97-1836(-)|eukprot:CAMPEP_0171109380 /NCGR_PEP_ID=MMETSP0766_2-20121228/70741_1 /TAXON_ID=439317 /ORGANISM="Gambierdiscus australes, Strain CAWD 149" /LENGTH=579 /DNA_ID=CAMNT_0011571111 /DNA_START=53 /DNA_END=1792 /DNA_ORIENTATION=+